MASLAKRWKRTVKRATLGWRESLAASLPQPVLAVTRRPAQWLDMLFIDHGIFRIFYLNKHRLSAEAWRAAQPAPHQIGTLAKSGVKTIVNLRGVRSCGSYWLEQAACDRLGLKLVDHQLRSRATPSKDELRSTRELLERLEYPILIHCKSGADRAGLMSVLYRHVRQGEPIEQAKRELSWRYGHIRQADTGILDAFFERYLADTKDRPMPFFEWVETVYDPDDVAAKFVANGLANRLVNGILRRE